MFEVVGKKLNSGNEYIISITIKNTVTGQIMTFNSFWEMNEFNKIIQGFKNEIVPF